MGEIDKTYPGKSIPLAATSELSNMPDVAFLKPSAAAVRCPWDFLEWISKTGGKVGTDIVNAGFCEREEKTAAAKATCRAVGKNTIVFDVEVTSECRVGPVG
jgi:hypothetical protein